jgi:hypothetical protein
LLRAVDETSNGASVRSDWTSIAGEVEIRPIVAPGIRHDTVVRKPYVDLLARELEACVDSALARWSELLGESEAEGLREASTIA